MSTREFTYQAGDEAPDLTLGWKTETTLDTFTDLDLSSGYTFTVLLIDDNGTTQLTKTTGITGADGSVVIVWAVDDLDLAAGEYTLRLTARETGSSKDRTYDPKEPPRLIITA